MKQIFYRDYSRWILAMEDSPRLAWLRFSRGSFRAWAALVGAVFVVALALLASRMQVIKNGYAIVELRQERDRLQGERRSLQKGLAELASLEHAEKVARQSYGMVDINPSQVIYLRDPAAPLPKRMWYGVKDFFGGKP